MNRKLIEYTDRIHAYAYPYKMDLIEAPIIREAIKGTAARALCILVRGCVHNMKLIERHNISYTYDTILIVNYVHL